MRNIFGVASDAFNVLDTVFSTDESESREFIGQYLNYILIFGGFFILSTVFYSFLFFVGKIISKFSRVKLIVFALLFVALHLNSTMRETNPYYYFYNTYNTFLKDKKTLTDLQQQIAQNIKSSKLSYGDMNSSNTLVLVIGESETSENLHLYRYERQTTPNLDKIKDEILIFSDVKAAAPATIEAFKYIFTSANFNDKEAYKTTPSIIQIAKSAGYKTFFISNHSTDNRGIIAALTMSADEFVITNVGKSRGEGSYDESVLEPYKKALNDSAKRKFIIVHILGSHPAYDFRYPKEFNKFTYEFDDKVASKLKNAGRAKYAVVFRNLYDNSVLYNDFIKSEILKELRNSNNENKSFLYFSDHGQDVSHNDNFSGHNYKAKQQWKVPLIFWAEGIKFSKNRSQKPVNLEYVNNTIIGLLGIQSDFYDEKNDIFREFEF